METGGFDVPALYRYTPHFKMAVTSVKNNVMS